MAFHQEEYRMVQMGNRCRSDDNDSNAYTHRRQCHTCMTDNFESHRKVDRFHFGTVLSPNIRYHLVEVLREDTPNLFLRKPVSYVH